MSREAVVPYLYFRCRRGRLGWVPDERIAAMQMGCKMCRKTFTRDVREIRQRGRHENHYRADHHDLGRQRRVLRWRDHQPHQARVQQDGGNNSEKFHRSHILTLADSDSG